MSCGPGQRSWNRQEYEIGPEAIKDRIEEGFCLYNSKEKFHSLLCKNNTSNNDFVNNTTS